MRSKEDGVVDIQKIMNHAEGQALDALIERIQGRLIEADRIAWGLEVKIKRAQIELEVLTDVLNRGKV